MLGKYHAPPPLAVPRRASSKKPKEPESRAVIDLRSDILKILLAIDPHANANPQRRVSIRNRTRESITRLLHYERNEEKLTKMKADAAKLLAMWEASN